MANDYEMKNFKRVKAPFLLNSYPILKTVKLSLKEKRATF